MANQSIKQAFERLWHHTVAAISSAKNEINNKVDELSEGKANITHTHEAKEIDTTSIGTKDLGGVNLADTLVEIEALLNSKTSFSGSYNDLSNKPTIPSKTSQLTNDSKYVTQTDLANLPDCNVAYATCETVAATAEKEVIVLGSEKWSLEVGNVVMVYFTTSNSATNVKINVNGTGAYPIWYNNAEYTSSGTAYTGYAKRVINYMFNGTHWVWVGASYDSNTTYKNVTLGHGYVTCSTAEATTAKVGTLASYALTLGGIVAVKFTYGVPANATLNINSKGAKKMFYRGSAITAGVIKAGDIATFIYDGTQYQLLTIDRVNTETWTFTLEDGSEVTKKVVVG